MPLPFCFPFNGAPREDVFHRWRKDLKRFNLYADNYPIAVEPAETTLKLVRATSRVPLVGKSETLQVALHGFAAYAYISWLIFMFSSLLRGPSPGRPSYRASPPGDEEGLVYSPKTPASSGAAFSSA